MSTQEDSKCNWFNCFYISCIILVLICFFGSLGYVIDGTLKVNDPLLDSNIPCGEFKDLENLTDITLEKDITSLYHWEYKITSNKNDKGTLIMRCPTINHDMNIKINDKYVGRTDAKILSTVSKIYLRDCHNNILYTIRTGDAFETLINQNKMIVSLEVRENNSVKYYVKKNIFFTENIDIYNTDDVKVANLYRNKYEDLINIRGWTWDIKIYDPINRPISPFILTSLVGQQSFSEKTDETDGCNKLFNFFHTIMIIFAVFICLMVCCGMYITCDNLYETLFNKTDKDCIELESV